MEIEFEKTMEHIVASIRSAGYERYDQLYGYLKTGDLWLSENWRRELHHPHRGARRLVKDLDREQLQQYVQTLSTNI